MIDPTHDRYRDDLAALLLGALEDDEARAMESHLAGCAACQSDERWLRAAIDVLPASVEQVEPPPELRKRLMTTVREEAKEQAVGSRRRERRPRRRFAFVLSPAAALAGAALIVLGGLGGYLLGNGGGGDGTTTVAVSGTGVQPYASGELTKADQGYPAIVRVRGLKPQRGRVYEVWLRREGSMEVEPSSLFAVHSDGTGSAAIPGGLDGIAEVMVSSEPEGGSDAPTTDPVLRATL